jgi:hypothetical protein
MSTRTGSGPSVGGQCLQQWPVIVVLVIRLRMSRPAWNVRLRTRRTEVRPVIRLSDLETQ